MATEVNLPALGESVTEGTVTRWLKSVGDSVAVDEPLLEVSTDKVDTEIPSPVAGTLLEIKAEEDDTVEVGAILAVIGEEGESSGDSGGDEDKSEPEPESEPEEEPQAEESRKSPSRSPSRTAEGRARAEEEPAAEKPAEEEKPAARRRR